MAKITRKQEKLYDKLVELHHKLIYSVYNKDKKEFDEIVSNIRKEVEDYEQK